MKGPGARLVAAAIRLLSGVRVAWHEALELDGRPRIFFANHMSHLDFIVIWSALPKPVRESTRPVAAKDYWERGRLRRCLSEKVFQAALVDRGRATRTANPIDELETLITGDRSSIILFPEGTRGSGDEISPFKSGLYHLARRLPATPLVPVYLENLNRILPKGEVLPIPLLSRCLFGAPTRLGAGETRAAFLERARRSVLALRDGEPGGPGSTGDDPQR